MIDSLVQPLYRQNHELTIHDVMLYGLVEQNRARELIISLVDRQNLYNGMTYSIDGDTNLSLIKGTSCSIFGLDDETIDRIVKKAQSYISRIGVPENYIVDVRKDKVTCCGRFIFGVVFEVKGPKIKIIKDLEKKIVGEIQSICKKESVECQGCASDGILLDVKGSVFDQDES